MDWLKTAALFVGLWLALEVAQLLLGAALWPASRILKRVYTPPHGFAMLTITWAAAAASVWYGWTAGVGRPILGIVLVIGAPVAALLATLTYRDQRLEAFGLPPKVTEVPRHLGLPTRVLLGIGATVSFAFGAFHVYALGWSEWHTMLAFTALGVVLAYTTFVGRYPALFLLFLGATERER